MISAALALSLLGMATASPIAPPRYPPTTQSVGFRLVVNVTDLSTDLTPPVHGTFISSIHVGAGLNYLGNVDDTAHARVFYVNGTSNGHPASDDLTTVSDGGSPPAPYGISLVADDENISTAHLDGGNGTPGVSLSLFPEPLSFLDPETWAACLEPLAYYQNNKFIIFKQIKRTTQPDGSYAATIPDECTAVRLLPEAVVLESVPPGSIASHDHALTSNVYADVSDINWSEY